MAELTPKQIKFCEEYLIDSNATQAAIRAGYSEDTAGVIGHENLKKPYIKEYINVRQKELVDKLKLTQERILQEYSKIAFFDIRNAFDDEGRLRNLQDLDDQTAGAIAGIESLDEIETQGEETFKSGTLRKIKVWDKRAALDSICKVLGFNAPEKHDLSTLGESLNKRPKAKLPDGTELEL